MTESDALREAQRRRGSVLLLEDGGLAVQEREAGAMIGWRRLDNDELLPIDTPRVLAAQPAGYVVTAEGEYRGLHRLAWLRRGLGLRP